MNLAEIAGALPMLILAGAFGGGLFWLIRRPDRDAPRLDASVKPPDVSSP